MPNTIPRAHVPVGAPKTADPDASAKFVHTSPPTDEQSAHPIAVAPITSRKDKRRQKKPTTPAIPPTPPDTDVETPPEPAPAPAPASAPAPLSKKARKQKKKQQQASAFYPSESDTENEPPQSTTTQSANPSSKPAPELSLRTPPTMPPGPSKLYPLLVCSIGNPGSAYANTLHSAGHTITTIIASVKAYQPFTKGLSGLVSRPDNTTFSFGLLSGYTKTAGAPPTEDDFTFWQSTTLMNVSGPAVKKAWNEFSRGLRARGLEGRLVVLHDELEASLGKVTVRDGTASPKGHNGLKSCQASLGGTKWWRVGVGIGRPESREPNVVSKYVLRKMTRGEIGAMEGACPSVLDALRQISEGKR
ncbi:peptidyl-tRNA hydrolase [Corynespora cassiicola Philippines]|uniref:peptidyl-tRNA hydrolase n=1 Tax=Corynespora cassiicola Philippines TaxID=1448308 RepID=A0A2T2P1K5_CORCC|nr:peptidyl-tRNA hydrolase [Corynespora cassiicola Philippines]